MSPSPSSSRTVRWHVIEGEAGCEFALAVGCVAVVVDALRASATAAMLLEAGATEIVAVREIEEAFATKRTNPDALLFGERGGLAPAGFDHGNSPTEAPAAAGRPVIFTTTTGAGRLVACWGCPAVFMGSTVNATAVAGAAAASVAASAGRAEKAQGNEVVVIPAGLASDPEFDAQEDWVAAAIIVRRAQEEAGRAGVDLTLGEGEERLREWCERIEREGVQGLFESAPHAGKLRGVGLGDDVAYCAQVDITTAVPHAVERMEHGVVMTRYEASVRER